MPRENCSAIEKITILNNEKTLPLRTLQCLIAEKCCVSKYTIAKLLKEKYYYAKLLTKTKHVIKNIYFCLSSLNNIVLIYIWSCV